VSISRFFSSFTPSLSNLVFFFVAPPHVKKKMDHQANRMIRPKISRFRAGVKGGLQINFTMAPATTTVLCISSGAMKHVVSLHAARLCKTPTMKAAHNFLMIARAPHGEHLCGLDEVTRTQAQSRLFACIRVLTEVPGRVCRVQCMHQPTGLRGDSGMW
jgi:hypothetical protein